VARQRGEDARLVGGNVEAVADAGGAAHKLQDRAVAEVERRPPEAAAQDAPRRRRPLGQRLGDPGSAGRGVDGHDCVRLP